jgi:hypothetical protein
MDRRFRCFLPQEEFAPPPELLFPPFPEIVQDRKEGGEAAGKPRRRETARKDPGLSNPADKGWLSEFSLAYLHPKVRT